MEPYVADLNDKAEFNGYGFGDDSYAPCTYINASGNTWMDARYSVSNDTNIDANVIIGEGTSNAVFGTGWIPRQGFASFCILFNRTDNIYSYLYHIYRIPISTTLKVPLPATNEYCTISLRNRTYYLNNEWLVGPFAALNAPFRDTLCFYACGDASFRLKNRAHYFKIWEKDALMAQFLPVYQRATKKYGFWDTQRKRFFVGSAGTFSGGIEKEYTT